MLVLQKKFAQLVLFFFIILFLVYGVKDVHNLVMHIVIHFQLSQKKNGIQIK